MHQSFQRVVNYHQCLQSLHLDNKFKGGVLIEGVI